VTDVGHVADSGTGDRATAHIGQTVIQHCDGCTITPNGARKLAEALVELAHYADSA
jgi:O-acetyl-ADP-ribose deacetylase (regulator of RNase III)